MTPYGQQVNELRSLDYRIGLMMQQGRYAEAQRFIDQLLPIYDWLGGRGQDPQRVLGRDRQHYVVLSQQCQLGGVAASADAATWRAEVQGHVEQARAALATDPRSTLRGLQRAREMVEKKQAAKDVKAPLEQDLQRLAGELEQTALALGHRARTTLAADRPRACAEYEAAIEVLKGLGRPVQAKAFEEELGTAVFAQQTGSRIDDVRAALRAASRAEDIDRLSAEMERIRGEVQHAQSSGGAAAAAQAGQMNVVLAQILREVEETKAVAAQQRQVIVAQNVHIGDQITVKDSVVQDSAIGGRSGAPAGMLVSAQHVATGSQVTIQDSVVQGASVASGAPTPVAPGPAVPQVPPPSVLSGTAMGPGPGTSPAGVPSGFSICPYCGKELRLPRPPVFCPFCRERLQ